MFSDVLLTVDFDRTLTAPDSSIPERNLDAIRFFMEHGGAFTVNTGRSIPMAWPIIEHVPLSAPLLLYNGSAAYDVESKKLYNTHPIPLDAKETIERTMHMFPDLLIEVQAMDAHYAFVQNNDWEKFSDHSRCAWKYTTAAEIPQPFLKYSLYIPPTGHSVSSLFDATEEDVRRMDEAEVRLKEEFGDAVEVLRAAPKIIDVSAKGTSKIRSARELQKALGRKILVCVGDTDNDLAMLEGADYSFCPADAALASRFPNVCKCADGAIADVIYERIPQILRITL